MIFVLGLLALAAGVSGEYTCSVTNQGTRVHEMTSPTPYDCVDNSCGNTCQGGQCVAYVTCHCTRNGLHAPGTNCWRPGIPVKDGNGNCNSAIPYGTAVATFDSGGNYYAGHTGVFIGCDSNSVVRLYDQWCCRSVGYSTYSSSHSYFSTYHVITNPSCGDRSSWPCRIENAGPTCCETWVSGCQAHRYWWQSFTDTEE